FQGATGAFADQPQVGLVVVQAQLAHALHQPGLQEGTARLAQHLAGAFLDQPAPGAELRGAHVGQGFQGPDAAWLHAVPLAQGFHRRPWRAPRSRQASPPPAGSLKPDTELRMSLASLARLPMLRAVAVVPAEVCEVIS